MKEAQELQTDAAGIARFALPQPAPQVLNVYAFPQTEKWYPANVSAETAVVLREGIEFKGMKFLVKSRDNPGQILIRAQQVTL